MAIFNVDRIFLCLQTRDEAGAESSENIRLFSGPEEVVNFNTTPPKEGKVKILEAEISFDYEELLSKPFFIGLSGADKWGPRSAFLWGRAINDSYNRHNFEYFPLAISDDSISNQWVSQEIQQGVDRWPLHNFTHLAHNSTNEIHNHVLIMETRPNPIIRDRTWIYEHGVKSGLKNIGLKVDIKDEREFIRYISGLELEQISTLDPGTDGPIQFSIYCKNGEFRENEYVCNQLAFQTILTKRGNQKPAVSGESYYATFPTPNGNRFSDFTFAELRNLSDDPWGPQRIWIFGISYHFSKLYARLITAEDVMGMSWYGQKSYPTETLRAFPLIYLQRHLNNMLDG